MQAQIRAGATAGKASLDELFELGIERDNDLWLRGHAGPLLPQGRCSARAAIFFLQIGSWTRTSIKRFSSP